MNFRQGFDRHQLMVLDFNSMVSVFIFFEFKRLFLKLFYPHFFQNIYDFPISKQKFLLA